MKKLALIFFSALALLFFIWQMSSRPNSLNKTGCKPYDHFILYEFEAEVINKFQNEGHQLLTLLTAKNQSVTIDLSLETNGLFKQLSVGDTLNKVTQSMSIDIKHQGNHNNFELDFNCN